MYPEVHIHFFCTVSVGHNCLSFSYQQDVLTQIVYLFMSTCTIVTVGICRFVPSKLPVLGKTGELV